MFGFFKKKEKAETWSVCVDDVYYNIDSKVARHFENLEYENKRLKKDVEELRKKIDEIQTYSKQEGYTPAISRECIDCAYVIESGYSGYGGRIIGCRKNMLCEDFKPKGE